MKFKLVVILLLISTQVFAFEDFGWGGDDAGNGGFAYKQSIKILEMATKDLEHKIIASDLKELNDYPERRRILQETLAYDHLQKLPKKNAYRGGRKLAMDYVVNPPSVKILKPYYVAFMGKTDPELEEASLEVQKRLLHEASHIWGFREADSEAFALRFLDETKVGETRPTNQVGIQNFCSCLNGKSDVIGDCDAFCREKPKTPNPILYLNTIMGPDIALNPKLGNLYNWCNAQLEGDVGTPQCFLSATDGSTTISNIPVSIQAGSNSLHANIQSLSLDKTYILKIVEGKSGSNAQSQEFQLRRKSQGSTDTLGALKLAPINQYTCFNYGGTITPAGDVIRNSYARVFYYFAANENPPPVVPAGGTGKSQIVCHDEQLHPGNDSAEYPRLEMIPQLFSMYDKTDSRFINLNGKLKINKILEERMYNEYGVQAQLDLFKKISFPNRPNASTHSQMGFIMSPFTYSTGTTFCPTQFELTLSGDPLFNLLNEYIDGTEGLFLAEKEAETIQDNGTYKTIYGTMFVTEGILRKYGFYIENGFKIRVSESEMNSKTIYYYWPTNNITDPLIQGNRKLFTVRSPEEMNGNIPTGIPTGMGTSDKRIGCIPRGAL